jgi:glycerol-3-phosphate acyltransferase PlsY
LVVLKATGKASLASLAVAVTAPVAIVAWRGTHTEAAVLGGVAVLVVARHGKNIRRLLHGEEGSVRGRKEQ